MERGLSNWVGLRRNEGKLAVRDGTKGGHKRGQDSFMGQHLKAKQPGRLIWFGRAEFCCFWIGECGVIGHGTHDYKALDERTRADYLRLPAGYHELKLWWSLFTRQEANTRLMMILRDKHRRPNAGLFALNCILDVRSPIEHTSSGVVFRPLSGPERPQSRGTGPEGNL